VEDNNSTVKLLEFLELWFERRMATGDAQPMMFSQRQNSDV